MTVFLEQSSKSYVGNGVTTAFPTTFRFISSSHLSVYVDDILKVEGTDYTVSGEDDPEPGGTVTFIAAPANSADIYIERNTPATQEVDVRPEGRFLSDDVEEMFDKLTLIAQEDRRRLDVLDALSDLVTVSELADAVRIGPKLFTTGDAVEDSFPFNIACPGGATAEFILWRIVTGGSELFLEATDVDWEVGANLITVKNVTGLAPNTLYAMKGLVFFEP